MIGNAAVVIFGAVVGTYVTAHTVRFEAPGTPLELAFVFAAIGALLSVTMNWVVLKLALRPLDGITRTVEEVRKGSLRARVERDPFSDPQIETLRETLNAMLDQLDEHGERLRALSSQIIKAQEEERLRIARELHDETAQALASLLVRQRVAERSPDAASLQRTMADLRALTSEALEGVRRMALELRPTMLDDLGLVAAVEAFARQFSQRTGIPVEVRMARRPERLPPEVELSRSGSSRRRSRTWPATAAPAGPKSASEPAPAWSPSALPTTATASSWRPPWTAASAAWGCSACASARPWSAAGSAWTRRRVAAPRSAWRSRRRPRPGQRPSPTAPGTRPRPRPDCTAGLTGTHPDASPDHRCPEPGRRHGPLSTPGAEAGDLLGHPPGSAAILAAPVSNRGGQDGRAPRGSSSWHRSQNGHLVVH